MNNPNQRYIDDVSKYPVMRQPEVRAIYEAHNATPYTSEHINLVVEGNLRLVMKIVGDVFPAYTMEDDTWYDLVSAGNVGLLEAARTYDVTKGAPFSSWARMFILKYTTREAGNSAHAVRIPTKSFQAHLRVQDYVHQALEDGRPVPTAAVIADALGMKVNTVIGLLHLEESDDEAPLVDVSDVEDEVDLEEKLLDSIAIDQALVHLTGHQCQVVVRYFGLQGMQSEKLPEIADNLGITKQAAHQALHRGLAILREVMA